MGYNAFQLFAIQETKVDSYVLQTFVKNFVVKNPSGLYF